ncbi:hypothetical protein ACA29_01990 [Lederbergia galactosidilytica]|uniref:Uncharacterized protein n=1 Tax=Lederbergia galactosidilytica TaxID=217031 RepID=A0A0Q9YJH1_9BACI|nr:hypothetical protein ACA29_01990 [Lederbergia galactosidilytica]
MSKEKFSIPYPDQSKIDLEVDQIVRAGGVKPHQSYYTYFVHLYKGIGWKYLFTNRRDGILITFSAMFLLIYLFNSMAEAAQTEANSEAAQTEANFYPILFIASPLLYISLSFYDFLHKRHHATYEVEMVTKYNFYQVAAFKMLLFSILAIFVNMVSILFVSVIYEYVHFFKAFLVSTTALFLFSILFLAIIMKKQTGVRASMIILGWSGTNILLNLLPNQAYSHFLLQLPIFVYGLVLTFSLILYFRFLNKLVQIKPAEGV